MHKYFFKLTALSLIEILITITIVLILCSISLYSYQDYKITAMYNSAIAIVEQNKIAISSFYSKNKACPTVALFTQTYNGRVKSVWTSITNNGCTINMMGDGAILLSFKAIVNDLGDMQYYCIEQGPAAPTNINTYVPAAITPCPPVPADSQAL